MYYRHRVFLSPLPFLHIKETKAFYIVIIVLSEKYMR